MNHRDLLRAEYGAFFDIALAEAEEAIGDMVRGAPPTVTMRREDVLDLVAMGFLRGQTWARERCGCFRCGHATWTGNFESPG